MAMTDPQHFFMCGESDEEDQAQAYQNSGDAQPLRFSMCDGDDDEDAIWPTDIEDQYRFGASLPSAVQAVREGPGNFWRIGSARLFRKHVEAFSAARPRIRAHARVFKQPAAVSAESLVPLATVRTQAKVADGSASWWVEKKEEVEEDEDDCCVQDGEKVEAEVPMRSRSPLKWGGC